MNLKIKSHKVTLTGTEITGDTFPVKSFIKDYLCGKWNAERKSWTVDLGQVEQFMSGKYPQITIDNGSETVTASASRNNNGLCPHCHTYCCGDCQSH